MTKRIGIFYFSATGNTEIIANLLKKEFMEHGYDVEIMRIEEVLKNDISIEILKYDLIGIGNNTIAFTSPKIVHDFVKKIPAVGNSKKVFIFRTAGGVGPINYNASLAVIKKLTKKGYNVIYDRVFSIGSNWIIKFDNDITKQLYQAAIHKIKLMCNDIINNKVRLLKTKLSIRVFTTIFHYLSKITIRFLAKDYKVSKDCNFCGICIKKCPVNNIYQKRNKIKFGVKCLCCMRCIYICPKKAIKFKLFSFFAVPGGYNPKVILNSPDNDDDKNGYIPPFFNNYIKNDDM